MTGFDDREKAFEAKYSHDEEQDFKIRARRNHLLGAWVAERLGLSGDAATAYARECAEADFKEPGEHDVLEKVQKDLAAKGVELSEHQIQREMDSLMETAREQIKTESA